MKKYLMIGIAAVAMTAAFTSCSKDKEFEQVVVDKKAAQYAESFSKTFQVTIDPENDWGFGSSSAAQTRAINTNANEWANTYQIPADPEKNDYEIDAVTAYFTDNSFTDAEECVNFDNFFVYSISYTENGRSHMDNFYCGASKISMEHLNNLNAGQISNNGHHGRSQLVEGGGSRYWNYQSSEGTKHTFEHFYAVEGSVIDSRLAGYYYIGFDYESAGGAANQVHAPDGKYNDVIIRISKAKAGHNNWRGRIFCEDLGAIGDFDFNDVVFDYDFENDKTWIKVVCAGGTIPLYVGDVEVHGEFGVDTDVMVNTGAGPELGEVIFSIPGNYGYNPANIPITVGGTEAELNDASSSDNVRKLVAEKGEAPQKLCVQGAFPAPSPEYINIGTTYSNFADYIADHNTRWW